MGLFIAHFIIGGEKTDIISSRLEIMLNDIEEKTGQSISLDTGFRTLKYFIKEHGEAWISTDEGIEVRIYDPFMMAYKGMELNELFQ